MKSLNSKSATIGALLGLTVTSLISAAALATPLNASNLQVLPAAKASASAPKETLRAQDFAISKDKLSTLSKTSIGGQDSGGGCVYTDSTSTRLLDFVAMDTNYKSSSAEGEKIRPSAVARALGTDELDVKTLKAYKRALQLARSWGQEDEGTRRISNLLVSAIKSNEFSQSVYIYNRPVKGCPVPQSLTGKVHAGVYYDDKVGALLFLPVWNRLDAESQAGLLVHEALRMIQVSMESGMSNRAIQLITASVVRGSPSVKQVLQAYGEFGELIQKQIQSRQFLVQEQKNLCIAVLQTIEKYPNLKASFQTCQSPERMDVKWAEQVGNRVSAFRGDSKLCDKACRSNTFELEHHANLVQLDIMQYSLGENDNTPEWASLNRGLRGVESADDLILGLAMDYIKEAAVTGYAKDLTWSQNQKVQEAIGNIKLYFATLVKKGILSRPAGY